MTTNIEPDTLKLWRAVEKTDPAVTKRVEFGKRKFTAIDAYSQIKKATELWGPMGLSWGYRVAQWARDDVFFLVELYLWYPHPAIDTEPQRSGAETGHRIEIGPVFGCAPMDMDAGKKATTDALTKALSYLGFNADVFLGRFDDNKYVAEARRQAAAANQGDGRSEAPRSMPTTKPTEPIPDWALKVVNRWTEELRAAETRDDFDATCNRMALTISRTKDFPDAASQQLETIKLETGAALQG